MQEPEPILPPPSSVTVDYERKPVLYDHSGKPLVKAPAGFDTRRRPATKSGGRP